MMIKSLYGFGMILVLTLLAAEAPATTYYVATNGSDTPGTAGTDWTTPFLTISNGVAKAQTNAGNVVLVSNGTYLTVAQIVLTNALTVRSWNNGVVDRDNTVVQRSGAVIHRLFHLKHVNALVEGFTITNGQITSGGGAGGVYIEQGGTLLNCIVANCVATNSTTTEAGGVMIYQTGLVDNCEIAGNRGYRAGGVYLLDGGLVSNCVIINNTNTYVAVVNGSGGGIRIINGGTATDCMIAGNLAKAYGGGIYVQTGSVYNCRVIGNTALGYGGGVAIQSGGYIRNCLIQSNLNESSVRSGALFFSQGGTAENCRVEGNLGNAGGGVYFYLGGVARSCLIVGNTATNYGGGAYFNGGTMENCTVVSNIATNATTAYGGGIYMDARVGIGYFSTILNTVNYGNTAASGSNLAFFGGSTLYAFTNCLVAPLPAQQTNSIAANPQFVDAPGGDYRLQRGSPCINTGQNEAWMTTAMDLDGHRRIDRYSGIVDMGCYEYVFHGTLFNLR